VPQARQNNPGAKRHNFPTGNFQLATIIHHSSFLIIFSNGSPPIPKLNLLG